MNVHFCEIIMGEWIYPIVYIFVRIIVDTQWIVKISHRMLCIYYCVISEGDAFSIRVKYDVFTFHYFPWALKNVCLHYLGKWTHLIFTSKLLLETLNAFIGFT